MNILVVGNGFDLAHNLPTTYVDFLNFVNVIRPIEDYHGLFKKFVSSSDFNKLKDDVKEYIRTKIVKENRPDADLIAVLRAKNDVIIKEILDLIKDNLWIEWFNKRCTKLGNTWIDFEAEISNVVQSMERMHENELEEHSNAIHEKWQLSADNNKTLRSEIRSFFANNQSPIDIQKSKDKMLKDLNKVIRCLELYFEDCVRKIDNSAVSMDIWNLNIDKVLSFNYTDTYKRLYSVKNKSVEYDYLHGKSKISTDTPNNMVLGIDEYLSKEGQHNNTNFIEFKKYFQRIHKSTGCVYKSWLDEINQSENSDHNVFIFGHSLAITDKDVMLEILNNDKISTTVFYKDSKHYAQLITNLVQLLGVDDLVSKVYGVAPRIVFKQQCDMTYRTNKEWQIFNDCQSLWHLYDFCDSDIESLISRITSKIDQCDLDYFCSQEKVIDLYDALDSNLEIDNMDKLLEIAKRLYSSNSRQIFSHRDWAHDGYDGIDNCSLSVFEFIHEINGYNFHQISRNTQDYFKTDDLNLLNSRISNAIIDKMDAQQLFGTLFSKLKEEDKDMPLIWECIKTLINKHSECFVGDFWEEKVKSADKMEKIRLNYIFDHIKKTFQPKDYV